MAAPALVYVDADGSLREWSSPLGGRVLARAWEGSRYAWPCFRPDGSSLACFSMTADGGDLLLVEASGHSMAQLYREHHTRPVYAAWSPDGRRLALLLQGAETLSLLVVDPERPGEARSLCEGGPIFFVWSPEGARLAVHRGKGPGQGGELLIYDLAEPTTPRRVAQMPGGFRAPAWSRRGDLAFLAADAAGERLVVERAGGDQETLVALPRVSAFVWSPTGDALAVGVAGEERSSFGRIEVVGEGQVRHIETEDAVAFGWLPGEHRLWVAAIEPTEMCLLLGWADPAGMKVLGRFVPSEETLYQLSFFDQYTQSHPLVSPDGTTLVFCGHPAGGASAPQDAQVFIVSLDTGEPVSVARGGVATWRPG